MTRIYKRNSTYVRRFGDRLPNIGSVGLDVFRKDSGANLNSTCAGVRIYKVAVRGPQRPHT